MCLFTLHICTHCHLIYCNIVLFNNHVNKYVLGSGDPCCEYDMAVHQNVENSSLLTNVTGCWRGTFGMVMP